MIKLTITNRKNNTYDITQLVQDVTWSGDYKQAARKLEFSIMSSKYDKDIPQVDIQEGYMVFFYEDGKELFRGFIYTIDKDSQQTSYMAYDHAQKLVNIKVNYNFKEQTAKQITEKMLNDYSKWGLKKGTIVDDNIPWSKVFIGVSMYDTIMSAYTNAHNENNKEYMCFAKEGKIYTSLKGDIKLKVQFSDIENIVSTNYHSSIENVVNKVIVVDDAGNEVLTEEDKNSQELYGLFQEVIKAQTTTQTTTTEAPVEANEPATVATTPTSTNTGGGGYTLNTSNSTAKSIFDWCISKGFSPAAAAGIVANAECESGFSTSVVNSIGASGLLQWLGGRLTNLKRKASARGVSWTNLALQLQHMLDEMNGEDSTTASLLNKRVGGTSGFKSLSDPYKAGYEFGKCFERGGYNEKRGTTAQKWYKLVVTGSGGSLPALDGGGTTGSTGTGTTTTQTQVIDVEASKKEAKKTLKERERSASLDGYGDPTCITGYGVTVTDNATGLTGLFYIDTDSHTWSNGEYRISLNLNYKNLMNEVNAGEDEQQQVTATGVDGGVSTGELNGKKVKAQFTAYYPANNKMEGGFYDAMGNKLDPSKRTCAAPKSIPFNTQIQVLNTGTDCDNQVYKVTDRGGAIVIDSNGVYHFDILKANAKEANAFGRRNGYAIIGDGTGFKTTSTGTTGGSAKAQQAVAAAKSKVGCRYVYGASPSSTTEFDCSSLMMYAYRQVGISLPRTSADQSKVGTLIRCSWPNVGNTLLPGDLCFFHTSNSRGPNGVTHVAMYIGNNQIVHARSSKYGVVITSTSVYKSIVCARRIV